MPTDFGTFYKAAHAEFKKGVADETIKRRMLLAELQRRGRISYNHDGTEMDWRVRYLEHDLNSYVDGGPVVFGRIDPYIKATLPYRAYDMNTVVTKKERLATQGKSAIFKLYEQKTKELKEDARKKFNGKLWGSGNTGTTDIHGLNSIFDGTYASGSKNGTANGTYAGIAQTLGANGGALGDSEYNFWTPTLVAWNSSQFTSPYTFKATAGEAIRHGIVNVMDENDAEMRVSVVCLAKAMFLSFLEYMAGKEQIYTSKGRQPGPVASLGFEAVWFDGVEVTWEHDVPANTGFGINFNRLELCCMTDQLFGGDVEYDIDTKAWKMDIDFWGNLKIESPRHFFKLAAA